MILGVFIDGYKEYERISINWSVPCDVFDELDSRRRQSEFEMVVAALVLLILIFTIRDVELMVNTIESLEDFHEVTVVNVLIRPVEH